ncbi:MAG: hypothetical protein ACRCZI_00475, partial [Cetobacterium sp.]
MHTGEIAFSEATIVPIRQIRWWTIAIKRRMGGQVQPTQWKRRKHEAGLAGVPTAQLSIQDMIKKRTEARANYRKAKKQHEQHRIEHIKKMPKNIQDKILRAERQRKLGRVAKGVTGKLVSKSITKVEYEGQEYTTQEDIERILLPVNEAKIRASEQTPFMQEPLLQEFGYREPRQTHEQVLQGTYQIPPSCDRATAILIRGLARPAVPHNTTIYTPRQYISTEDHIKGWKKQRERTSGGMSGLHFGQYKAHLESPLLAAFDASMRSVAYTTGYSFRRWRKGLDVQLLKKLQCYHATNLRTILL